MLEPREPREDDNEHTTMLAMGGAVHRSNDKGQERDEFDAREEWDGSAEGGDALQMLLRDVSHIPSRNVLTIRPHGRDQGQLVQTGLAVILYDLRLQAASAVL